MASLTGVVAQRSVVSAAAPRTHRRCPTMPSQPILQKELISAAIPSRQHFTARSIPVSGPPVPEPSGAPAGQISAQLMEAMTSKIGAALETQQVVVQDVYGDGRHVSISVVSKLFDGKNAVQRQRMVYKAIWEELQEAVHAVDEMSCKTPQEAA